jgi:hypothetical protein
MMIPILRIAFDSMTFVEINYIDNYGTLQKAQAAFEPLDQNLIERDRMKGGDSVESIIL